MFQPVRGTRDLLPETCAKFRKIVETASSIMTCYGFSEIETPIFEFAPVFRHMGETSDVVTKETYTFMDRGQQEITLRPEGTAGVVRSILSNGLTQDVPLKYYYSGPMFRYERPQKGRYRQFYQLGAELIGVQSAQADVEVISMCHQILKALELENGMRLEINSLGDTASRDSYRQALITYLNDYRSKLSEDSLRRLDINPLRILDSKDEADQQIVASAPIYREYLNAESEDFFAKVLQGLDDLSIPYNLNYKIVRGLDYYCHTTFEFVSDDLGSQGAICAGGRYDTLFEQMGGPALPGVGWAAGVDRLLMLSQLQPLLMRPVTLIPLGGQAENTAIKLSHELRSAGIVTDLGYSGNMTKRLKRANKNKASYAVIFGDDELASAQLTVRNLDTGEQQVVAVDHIVQFFKNV
ncbi:MAG: histidine--tRNA ligase [Alphaproteobacteria bacterium]|nr:histidine--tRNA ligase [Alphaproteobacteria bacterium]